LTFVATLGGLLFGYDTAVISGAVSSIDANFIDPQHLSETARSSLSGWTVSSALFGCIIGAIVAGWVSKAIGRKGGMIVAGALFLISAAGSAYPEFGLGPIGGMGPQGSYALHSLSHSVRCRRGHRVDAVASIYRGDRPQPDSRPTGLIQPAVHRARVCCWSTSSTGLSPPRAMRPGSGLRAGGLMLVSEAVPALLFLGIADAGAGYAALVCDEGPQSTRRWPVLNRLVGEERSAHHHQEIENSLVPGIPA
jgi:SP family xylose:H+ symportor-like MFS transporter